MDNIVLYFSNILGCNSFLNPTPLSHKDRNELQKIYNGNRCCTKSINIVHFNKGNSKFENRLSDIDRVISKYKPDIIHIAEANMGSNFDSYIGKYSEYNFERNLMYNDIGNSRNILMINKKLQYSRCNDLENNITCTIWVQIKLGKSKNLLYMGGYRQWQTPNILDPQGTSNSANNQIFRLKSILDKWKLASDEKTDMICTMDDNIDTNIDNTNNLNSRLLHILNDHLVDNNII